MHNINKQIVECAEDDDDDDVGLKCASVLLAGNKNKIKYEKSNNEGDAGDLTQFELMQNKNSSMVY